MGYEFDSALTLSLGMLLPYSIYTSKEGTKLSNLTIIMCTLAIPVAKVALLLLLKRIFVDQQRNRLYWFLMLLLGLNVGFYFAGF